MSSSFVHLHVHTDNSMLDGAARIGGLLDEVVAHLDVDKRGALFDLIRTTGIQAWMTGTDAADFQGLQGFATQLEIDGGTARMC